MLTENQIPVTESAPDHFLISEEHPYFLPIRNTYINPNDCLVTTIGNSNDYKNEEFGKLLQTISSIGSCSLSKKIDAGVKQYFLGEKLRIRKCSYSIKEGALTAFAYPSIQTNRKGRAIIDIVDEDEVVAYRFELDYNVFSQQTFEKLFKNYFKETTTQVLNKEMPATKNVIADESSFSVLIDKFSESHCLGHFRNHPIVPAVFIVKCLLSGIKNWLSSEMKVQSDMVVDSLEIFPNKAMPIDTELKADIKVQKLAPKIFMFICSIKDQNQNEYVVYPITFQI